MHLAVVGLSHRTAPVEVRERLSIPEHHLETSLQSLRSHEQVLETSILSTCNRLEIYSLLRHPEEGVAAIRDFLANHSGLADPDLQPHLFALHHEEAIQHLLRVSAGLDSLVLGEGQILSQVKKMYRLGQDHKSIGPILNRLLNQAVSTGKRVRSETNLGSGAVSISSAAVELAQLKVGQEQGIDDLVSLGDETVAVVGAGRMGRLLIQHLQAKGARRVTLVNRTLSRAESLAADFPELGIRCCGLDALDEQLQQASLLFTSTGADEPIIDRARLEAGSRPGRLMLVDIGVPRNISADAADACGVQCFDVDDLKEVVERNVAARQELARQAEVLLEEDRQARMHQALQRMLTFLGMVLKESPQGFELVMPANICERHWLMPENHNYRRLSPLQAAPGLVLAGDSVFPGQSTLAVSLGGIKAAEVIAHRCKREQQALVG